MKLYNVSGLLPNHLGGRYNERGYKGNETGHNNWVIGIRGS